MRRSVFLIVGCTVSLLVGVVPALADNGPHVKGQGGNLPATCAACHRAHTGQAPYLLREKQEQLCFTCHGSAAGGSSLDVQEGAAYSGTSRSSAVGALRGGGFKYALIKTGEVTKEYEGGTGRLVKAKIPALGASELQPATSAHSIDESSQMAWGNGAINGAEKNYGANINLTCGSCHDPHGNGMYRILRPVPVEAEQKGGAKITPVEIPDTATKVYATENYWNSWDPNDTEFEAKISAWCATCHTRLLAPSGSGSENSGDAVFSYRHTTEYSPESWKKLKEEHEKGIEKAKPNCIQCHVAHGTDATMGGYAGEVTYPNGKTTESPLPHKEDSFLLRLNNRGVCQTCHNK